MSLTPRDIAELKRRCPGTTVQNRPKPKVKPPRRTPGSFPESLAGIPDGRTVVVRDNNIIHPRKKEDRCQ